MHKSTSARREGPIYRGGRHWQQFSVEFSSYIATHENCEKSNYQGKTLSDPYIRIHIYGIIVRKSKDNGKVNKLTKIVVGCIVLIRKCWAKKFQATDENSFQVFIKISAFENPTQPPKLWAPNSHNSALSHQKWNLKSKGWCKFLFLMISRR